MQRATEQNSKKEPTFTTSNNADIDENGTNSNTRIVAYTRVVAYSNTSSNTCTSSSMRPCCTNTGTSSKCARSCRLALSRKGSTRGEASNSKCGTNNGIIKRIDAKVAGIEEETCQLRKGNDQTRPRQDVPAGDQLFLTGVTGDVVAVVVGDPAVIVETVLIFPTFPEE
eukprot:TRINITY_DN130_c0_g1_i20.p1 TRINITY_DN130_c0_g1~~TRINITY_DN130_c0_g1_i20.p1  ORF type:complete len:169 (-),score=28.95 TRINITY_DN130_c0_g1_i20:244-750(-)